RSDLPTGQVDRLQAGADLLDGLVTGQRTESVDVVGLVQQLPQPFSTLPSEGVLLLDRTAEPDDVVSRVGALDALPARVGLPVPPQFLNCLLRLLADAHGVHLSRIARACCFSVLTTHPR